MRVGGDGEAADAWNILGRAVNCAGSRFDALRIDVDIIDRDIARPARLNTHGARFFGDRHQAADHRWPDGKKRIGAIGHARILRVPADHISIEKLQRLCCRWSSGRTRQIFLALWT